MKTNFILLASEIYPSWLSWRRLCIALLTWLLNESFPQILEAPWKPCCELASCAPRMLVKHKILIPYIQGYFKPAPFFLLWPSSLSAGRYLLSEVKEKNPATVLMQPQQLQNKSQWIIFPLYCVVSSLATPVKILLSTSVTYASKSHFSTGSKQVTSVSSFPKHTREITILPLFIYFLR